MCPHKSNAGDSFSEFRTGMDRAVFAVSERTELETHASMHAPVEQLGPRDFGPPVHSHDRESEAFYVLEGELSFVLGRSGWGRRPAPSWSKPNWPSF